MQKNNTSLFTPFLLVRFFAQQVSRASIFWSIWQRHFLVAPILQAQFAVVPTCARNKILLLILVGFTCEVNPHRTGICRGLSCGWFDVCDFSHPLYISMYTSPPLSRLCPQFPKAGSPLRFSQNAPLYPRAQLLHNHAQATFFPFGGLISIFVNLEYPLPSPSCIFCCGPVAPTKYAY